MKGIYTADASSVNIIGFRGGWVYITFTDGSNEGITTKVPTSWVTPI